MYDTLLQSDTVQPCGRVKEDTRPGGVGLRIKTKDLSAHESEECEHGKGGGVYATLLQSDTVHPYGRAKEDTRPVGVDL